MQLAQIISSNISVKEVIIITLKAGDVLYGLWRSL